MLRIRRSGGRKYLTQCAIGRRGLKDELTACPLFRQKEYQQELDTVEGGSEKNNEVIQRVRSVSEYQADEERKGVGDMQLHKNELNDAGNPLFEIDHHYLSGKKHSQAEAGDK